MYGKLFDSMYDGTLAGHWQAIVTLQQLVILANADGVVDMTVEAIARRTTIPERIISAGIAFLLLPDQYSRTPGEDGKRIVPLDDHRPWGWRLVNHWKYRALRDQSQKREADRERISEKRKNINDVAIVSQMSQMSPMQYADADADTKEHAEAQRLNGAQHAKAVNSNVIEKLPLREGGEYEVLESLVSELEPLYPAVDIKSTLREMRGWLVLNTDRRKTRRGIRRFIGSWLQVEQEKHGG